MIAWRTNSSQFNAGRVLRSHSSTLQLGVPITYSHVVNRTVFRTSVACTIILEQRGVSETPESTGFTEIRAARREVVDMRDWNKVK